MVRQILLGCAGAVALLLAASCFAGDEVPAALPTLKVPEGFVIELAAGPPLVERPIVAAFDDEGRLYVADSSGSNDPVQKQLAEKPHRILRLEDTDGDGKFDRRTVFADHMMFPEGAMFLDGSLYVSAPPSIWKLTDTNGDGVADERAEWFKGGTLTGCANDLHGPYLGPDGWVYWCKGAFGEQTHEVDGHEWKSKASHIFRCRSDGSGFEPVITCGMDNPVDVAFMPDGERILSGTYFADGPRHDGLAHAIYGGVYGKQNGVLVGHPRTGELMPLLVTMSAAACCGLDRYDSGVFGADYRDNLFLCQFNMRKVSRHVLKPTGSTYSSEDHDFVTSDFVDFHPTDVLVDADGSLLVIDTGGWYKLCCPTSQLWKPDVGGGIYRVRKVGAKGPADPRGRMIAWGEQTPAQLWKLLAEERSAVRQRATQELVRRKDSSALKEFVAETMKNERRSEMADTSPDVVRAATARVWALAQIDTPDSRKLIREQFLVYGSDEVKHAAMQSISLQRDREAVPEVRRALRTSSVPANRRIAAEALGRIGDREAVPSLLYAASQAEDRILQHSIIYGLIQLDDPAGTRRGLADKSNKTIAAALIALDQMRDGDIRAGDVIPHLGAEDPTLRDAAEWVVKQHAEWGGELSEWLKTQLQAASAGVADSTGDDSTNGLVGMLALFASDEKVQQLLAETVKQPPSVAARDIALRAMIASKLQGPAKGWIEAIATAAGTRDATQLSMALAAARRFPIKSAASAEMSGVLSSIGNNPKMPLEARVVALAIISGEKAELDHRQFELLRSALSTENPVAVRSAAADAISKAHLNKGQLSMLCDTIATAGPLELNRLFKPFEQINDEQLGLKLVASLGNSSALASLRVDLLREALRKYDANVQAAIAKLEARVNVDAADQRKRIEELMPYAEHGEVRRGHAVFYSTKATCTACHRMGYAGGTIGPELTHVGETRTLRDLLESIVYPSLSFVRSYEPVLITTQDGKTINGVIKEETATEYVVATGPDQLVRLRHEDVDEIQPSKVSIMPAGFDKQLTPQELGDLVAFLKNPTDAQKAKPRARK